MGQAFNGPLEAALKAYSTDQWDVTLPSILLDFRTVLKEDSQATTVDFVYGISPRLPGEFFVPTAKEDLPQQLVEKL